MGNRQDIRVILGSLRYKSAPDTDLSIPFSLSQTEKEYTEFDRSVDVNLEQVYNDERQKSENFRPTSKFTLIFKNAYSGFTNYGPFENNLYYLDAEAAAAAECNGNAATTSWTGLPQYNEFDFIRNDYNVPGYTQPPSQHLIFEPKSASTYNWNFYVSYPFENDFNKNMQAVDKNGNSFAWVVSDGIPFILDSGSSGGLGLISFVCPVKHGVSQGEFIKLNFSYNGIDTFQVDSLGNGFDGSEEYILNIVNVGYTGTTFSTGQQGTFKRVILNDNVSDTISEYYVRKHKIMTYEDNTVLTKCGFEQNLFGIKKKYESSGFTPNGVARVSIKEGAQSYSLSFNQDININNLLDNQKRPISELFFTVIWKGYFGWTLGIKQGWEFNLPLDPNSSPPLPTNWWLIPDSDTSVTTNTYTTPPQTPLVTQQPFIYNVPLASGDTIDGDYCEWNNYEQKERVISEMYHKFKFNSNHFNINDGYSPPLFGYYYKTHHSVTIREYSPYIEDGNVQNIVGVPDYAYFSTTKNLFIWRDLYPYGYVDTDGVGVDYPFLNGTHYPYKEIIFRIIPEGTNYSEQVLVSEPTIDDCE